MIALDTNLLAYAQRRHAPEHDKARDAIEQALSDSRGCGISLPSIAEYWKVVTHPRSEGGPSTPREAEGFFRSLLDQTELQIWIPRPDFTQRLLRNAVDLSVSGHRIFDLQIALIALENGATEIWTHDRDFLKVRGLRVYDPLS